MNTMFFPEARKKTTMM